MTAVAGRIFSVVPRVERRDMNGLPLGLVAVPGRHDTVDEQEHGQGACCGAAGDMRSGCAEKLTGVQTRTLRKQTCVRRVLVGSSLPEDSEGK